MSGRKEGTAAGRVSRKDAVVEKCYLPVNSGTPGSYCHWLSAKHCQDTKSQFMSGFSLTRYPSFLTFLGQLIMKAGTGHMWSFHISVHPN